MYVSERMKLDFNELFTLKSNEVVIYNPYDINRVLKEAKEEPNNFIFQVNKRYLVTVGRLISLKRFQDVIKALRSLPDDVELIYDFGGYPDNRVIQAVKASDWLIVPVIYDSPLEMQTTIKTIN